MAVFKETQVSDSPSIVCRGPDEGLTNNLDGHDVTVKAELTIGTMDDGHASKRLWYGNG